MAVVNSSQATLPKLKTCKSIDQAALHVRKSVPTGEDRRPSNYLESLVEVFPFTETGLFLDVVYTAVPAQDPPQFIPASAKRLRYSRKDVTPNTINKAHDDHMMYLQRNFDDLIVPKVMDCFEFSDERDVTVFLIIEPIVSPSIPAPTDKTAEWWKSLQPQDFLANFIYLLKQIDSFHQKKLVHGGVAQENIFINTHETNRLSLVYFNNVREFGDKARPSLQHLRDPASTDGLAHPKQDMYAAGLTMVELLLQERFLFNEFEKPTSTKKYSLTRANLVGRKRLRDTALEKLKKVEWTTRFGDQSFYNFIYQMDRMERKDGLPDIPSAIEWLQFLVGVYTANPTDEKYKTDFKPKFPKKSKLLLI